MGVYPDQEVRDRDSEQKSKSRGYADERRGARHSDIAVGDTVLMKRDTKENKLVSSHYSDPYRPGCSERDNKRHANTSCQGRG